jgi:phage head maturation protease
MQRGGATVDYKVARFTGLKELKDTGEFIATIAKLNHIDLDEDVTLPGAFPEGKTVQIARWGHNWADLPYGVAVLHQEGDEEQAHGKFNLETTHGRDAYHTVKMGQDIQEWSYGFQILEADYGDFNGQPVRFLKRLDVAEISPVMRGAAGPGMTRVEEIKGAGYTMDEQTEMALAAVSAFLDRVKSLTDVRAKSGRPLNAVNAERVQGAITEALPELEALLALTQADGSESDEAPKASPAAVENAIASWEYTATRLRSLGLATV